jgi:putative tricarboxylic transport membrane protein
MHGARLGERLFGAFLLGVGLYAIYKASALPFGSLREPDAGLFPVSIAVLLTLLAASSLATRRYAGDAVPAEHAGIVRLLVLIASIVAYAWLLPRIGFLLCTIALLVIMLRVLGRVGWWGTGISALVGSVGCYLLFTRLGLPLPAGWIGF